MRCKRHFTEALKMENIEHKKHKPKHRARRKNDVINPESGVDRYVPGPKCYYESEVEKFLSSVGFGLGPMHPSLMKLVDEGGLRPCDPSDMKKFIGDAFSEAEIGPDNEPMFTTNDFCLDFNRGDDIPFGYLPGKEFHCEFDKVPWMGICGDETTPGTVDAIDDYDMFGDDCDSVGGRIAEVLSSNKTQTFTPVSRVSDVAFKEVNDATRNFQSRYQTFAHGDVLVLGSGSNSMCTTFDLSLSSVTYVDMSPDNLQELQRRMKEMGCRPGHYRTIVGGFHDIYHVLKKKKYNLVVLNHSYHYVAEGNLETKRKTITMLLDLLAHKGALIGVGPSLSGMVSTPMTNDIRNTHGLYGVDSGDQPVTYANLGGVQYIEPVAFIDLLYGYEEEYGGKFELCHLSGFVAGQHDSDLLRCYEGFSFVLSSYRRPTNVTLHDYGPTVNPAVRFGVGIDSREPPVVKVVAVDKMERCIQGRTFGELVRAQHLLGLMWNGPLLVSKKLDGVLVEVRAVVDVGWFVLKKDETLQIDYDPPKTSATFVCEMISGSDGVRLWWLETLANGFKPTSWMAGLWNLPEFLGVKEYRPLVSKNLLWAVSDTACSDGVVIHNPHDRIGGFKPKHLFYKPKLSVDIKINNTVYEILASKAVKRDHDPNGSLRAFESPFLVNFRCLLSAVSARTAFFSKVEDFAKPQEGVSLDAVFGYPRLMASVQKTRTRNTALVQLLRGQFQCDEFLMNIMVPVARHPDWALFGLLLDSIQGGVDDKDNIVPSGVVDVLEPPSAIDKDWYPQWDDEV